MTIKEILANSSQPQIEKEILLAHVLKKDKSYLHAHPEVKLTKIQVGHFQKLVERRTQGEPIQYLTNTAHFYGLEFFVDKRVLIPRQETEEMVYHALEFIKNNLAAKVVDVGTGSGNIIISVAKHLPTSFKGKLIGIDVSPKALEVAKRNAQQLKVETQITFLQGNLLRPLKNKVDLILANLPYVRTHLYGILDPQITWEPKIAILGGDDGMKYYRQLFEQSNKYLNPEGIIFYEVDGKVLNLKLQI